MIHFRWWFSKQHNRFPVAISREMARTMMPVMYQSISPHRKVKINYGGTCSILFNISTTNYITTFATGVTDTTTTPMGPSKIYVGMLQVIKLLTEGQKEREETVVVGDGCWRESFYVWQNNSRSGKYRDDKSTLKIFAFPFQLPPLTTWSIHPASPAIQCDHRVVCHEWHVFSV